MSTMAETIAVGAALGLMVASVPGPGWVLTIERTLARGWAVGMSGGTGIATVHGLYGAVAAYGMVAVTGALLGERRWLALVGGAALVLLGLWRLARRPMGFEGRGGDRERQDPRRGGRLLGSYASMAAFTVGNPQAVVTFLAGFATLRLGQAPAGLAAAAVAAGSLAWWVSLTSVVAALRRRLNGRTLVALRRGSGAALVALGVLGACVAWGFWL
jgi:putative LysE/RhtB family amino acid efflux pump